MSGDQLQVYPSGRLIGKEDRGTKNLKVNIKTQGLDRFRPHGVQYPTSYVGWCLYCVGWVYKRGCRMLWSYGLDGLSEMPPEGPPWPPYIGQRPRITSRLGSNPIGLQQKQIYIQDLWNGLKSGDHSPSLSCRSLTWPTRHRTTYPLEILS